MKYIKRTDYTYEEDPLIKWYSSRVAEVTSFMFIIIEIGLRLESVLKKCLNYLAKVYTQFVLQYICTLLKLFLYKHIHKEQFPLLQITYLHLDII